MWSRSSTSAWQNSLGRRILANSSPDGLSAYSDVYRGTQNNQWADYVITKDPDRFMADATKRYKIERGFGKWTILAPHKPRGGS